MATDDQPLTVDDLVSGRTAAQLGEGVIPTKAILIVETLTERGTGLRYVASEGVDTWQALGMLRSVQLRLEDEDLATWQDDE